jgi:hypothetical protein
MSTAPTTMRIGCASAWAPAPARAARVNVRTPAGALRSSPFASFPLDADQESTAQRRSESQQNTLSSNHAAPRTSIGMAASRRSKVRRLASGHQS